MHGRPVVVVSDPRELAARRKDLKPSCASRTPSWSAWTRGADALLAAGHQPDVVVVTAAAEPPSAKASARPRTS